MLWLGMSPGRRGAIMAIFLDEGGGMWENIDKMNIFVDSLKFVGWSFVGLIIGTIIYLLIFIIIQILAQICKRLYLFLKI